jgi:putative pyruvate formate lyase activating enzyme
MGKTLNIEETVQIFFQLKEQGAENINIVTGSHAIPFLAKAMKQAKEAGLDLPICWNCSAYESVEALEMLKGLVDIWLPDLKTLNPMMSEAVFKAADYPAAAKKAIRWMIKNTKSRFITVSDKSNPKQTKEKMLSGVIIRHLVMPGRLEDTILTLDWLEKMTSINPENTPCISLMMQYTPVSVDKNLFSEKELQDREKALASFSNRLINKEEFQRLQELIQSYNFEYLFYQELEEDTEWLPDFNRPQPFSNELAKVVWHHNSN